jgi:phosphatidylserine/phosphatidylglycerophosphate/cardiolipin synthase-like enzyme
MTRSHLPSLRWLSAVLLLSLLLLPLAAQAAPKPALTLITEPDQGYAPIYKLLAAPRHSLDLTMYELVDSKAEQILAADAKRGIRVRVLLDKEFSGARENQDAFSYLSSHKIQVRWASTQVEITHQKSFVIDGKEAVVMTGNLTSEYYSTTRDFAVVDLQAKDVAAIETTFGLDWSNKQGSAPAGADLLWSPGSQAPLVGLIGSAKHSLLVENEELKAPEIVAALLADAKRGVKVTLIMTRQSDWYDNFSALAKAGVDVSTYSDSSKALYIHAKVIVVDGQRVFLGSENFSVGSMQYNRELGLVTSTPTIVSALAQVLDKDAADGERWTP